MPSSPLRYAIASARLASGNSALAARVSHCNANASSCGSVAPKRYSLASWNCAGGRPACAACSSQRIVHGAERETLAAAVVGRDLRDLGDAVALRECRKVRHRQQDRRTGRRHFRDALATVAAAARHFDGLRLLDLDDQHVASRAYRASRGRMSASFVSAASMCSTAMLP